MRTANAWVEIQAYRMTALTRAAATVNTLQVQMVRNPIAMGLTRAAAIQKRLEAMPMTMKLFVVAIQ